MSEPDPYTFDTARPEDWQNPPAPYLNPRYQHELVSLAGTNIYGEPNLLIEWGGSARETPAGTGQSELRYWLTTTPPKVMRAVLARGVYRPVHTTTDIGVPRWFVSKWIPAQIAGREWPRGRYVYFIRVQDAECKYSPFNDFWMEKTREHWHYTQNMSDAEYARQIKAVTASPDVDEGRATATHG